MATRSFNYGDPDYLARLNELATIGMPRARANPDDPNSAPTDITLNRTLKFNDNGSVFDCTAAVTLAPDVSTMVDGWSLTINAIGGTVTIDVAAVGAFKGGIVTSKSVLAGNACVLSCDGSSFRIFRMTST